MSSPSHVDKPVLAPSSPPVTPVVKAILLTACFLAQVIDSYNGAAFFIAIPPISFQLGIDSDTSVWLISAYQLTFASFLLGSGRLADLFGPKYVFIGGLLVMSFTSLGAGFTRSEVPLILLRAIQGIGAAMNLPSAIALIIRLCPEQPGQARALAVFNTISGIGGIVGLFIGAAFVVDASWPWVLYFTTIYTFVVAMVVFFCAPSHLAEPAPTVSSDGTPHKIVGLKRVDVVGILLLTSGLILFIFAVTSGSATGWGSARVIAPLVISVVLAVAFALWERWVDEINAVVPPSMWRYKNFAVLVGLALLPIMWWAAVQFLFSWVWQQNYGYSSTKTALHILPLLLVCFVAGPATDILQKRVPLKYVILLGQFLLVVGNIVLPFGNAPNRFWRFVVPGMIIASSGNLFILATANVALFHNFPASKAGTAAAVFSCANQLGSATGSAIVATIQANVGSSASNFKGTAASLWFLLAINVVGAAAVVVFMKYVPATEAGKPVEGASTAELATTNTTNEDPEKIVARSDDRSL